MLPRIGLFFRGNLEPTMTRAFSLFLLLSLLLGNTACVINVRDQDGKIRREAQEDSEHWEDSAEEEDHEFRELREAVEQARRELEIARLDMQANELETRLKLQGAELELVRAQADLENFRTVRAPMMRQQTEQSLQSSRDSLLETEEEMQQLEMMYGADELADATAEIVLARTKRRLERARQSLALEEMEAKNNLEFDLPREEQELEQAVQEAEVGLANARLEIESSRLSAIGAVEEAEQALRQAEEELEEAEEEE
ncbi:MAG: hypothetical protein DWQ01_02840 [Planctomycetota bacterium]|nr:MAG: hypothetical protein DWQ01_02840 [Planctomycetota bacterium]